jgi:phosphatidylinositol-4,5-bisphosphate 3-kinase
MENDNALLESILNKDSLAELTEQEKNVLWRRREDCVNYPHSLPKLLQSVKWFHQSDLIQVSSVIKKINKNSTDLIFQKCSLLHL